MNTRKLLLLLTLAVLVGAFFAFDLGRFFSLDYFKSQQAAIEAYLLDQAQRHQQDQPPDPTPAQ